MSTKGYWVKEEDLNKELEEGQLPQHFEGWSDDEVKGHKFYTQAEFFESIENCWWCPDAGYINEPFLNCRSKAMGLCDKC